MFFDNELHLLGIFLDFLYHLLAIFLDEIDLFFELKIKFFFGVVKNICDASIERLVGAGRKKRSNKYLL